MSAAWKQVAEQLDTITGQQTSTIGEHINWLLHVQGERARIAPTRADLRVPYEGVTGNTQALAELEALAATVNPVPTPARTSENTFENE